MGLIQLLILLIVIGVLLYVVERVLPIDGSIKLIIRVVVILVVVLWLVQLLVGDVAIPRFG